VRKRVFHGTAGHNFRTVKKKEEIRQNYKFKKQNNLDNNKEEFEKNTQNES
jgi:hypothetical protein